jgi:hypothetical protein
MKQTDCTKRRLAAVCGDYCGACRSFVTNTCCGCGYQLGGTCQGECAVFQCCVLDRGLEHCGICPDFPCQIFLSCAAPLQVAHRYQSLMRRSLIGTNAWLDEQEAITPRPSG